MAEKWAPNMKSWVKLESCPHGVLNIAPSTYFSFAQNIRPLFQNGEFCLYYYQTSGEIFPKFVHTCIEPHTQFSGVLHSLLTSQFGNPSSTFCHLTNVIKGLLHFTTFMSLNLQPF